MMKDILELLKEIDQKNIKVEKQLVIAIYNYYCL